MTPWDSCSSMYLYPWNGNSPNFDCRQQKAAAHFAKAQNHLLAQTHHYMSSSWDHNSTHSFTWSRVQNSVHGVPQGKQQNTQKTEPCLLPSTELIFLLLNYLANKCEIEEPISQWCGTDEQVPVRSQLGGGEAQEMHNHLKIFLFSLYWVAFTPVSPSSPVSHPLSGHLTRQVHEHTVWASENLRNPLASTERNQLDSLSTWKSVEDNIRWGTVPVCWDIITKADVLLFYIAFCFFLTWKKKIS